MGYGQNVDDHEDDKTSFIESWLESVGTATPVQTDLNGRSTRGEDPREEDEDKSHNTASAQSQINNNHFSNGKHFLQQLQDAKSPPRSVTATMADATRELGSGKKK
jgi:hypothetical protein